MKKLLAILTGMTVLLTNGIHAQVFIENKGQIVNEKLESNRNVLFLANCSGMNVQLHDGGFSYDIFKPLDNDSQEASSSLQIDRVELHFVGGSTELKIEPLQQSQTKRNYYGINSEHPDVEGVLAFESVLYNNVYPGVDFLLKTNQNHQFEYDIVVNNSLALNQVALRYNGASIELMQNSSLLVKYEGGQFIEYLPKSFLTQTGAEIAVQYVISDNIVRFKTIASYTDSITIDPLPNLSFASYLGGEKTDLVQQFDIDANGNSYCVGSSNSTTNIATSGAYQTTLGNANNFDGFIFKISPTNELLWCTYFGNFTDNGISDIKCADNSIYILGATQSESEMTSTDAYQSVYGGGLYDALLAKFNESGQRVWSTLFGGSDQEYFNALEIDAEQNIVAVGYTYSTDLPITPDSYQSTLAGQRDGMITKWDSNGNLIYSSYFGGSGSESGLTISSQADGSLFIGIATTSTGLSSGAYATETNHGGTDALLCKFMDNQLVWSRYIGSELNDAIYSLQATQYGLLVGGATRATTGIATPGAYQTNPLGPFSSTVGEGFYQIYSFDGALTYGTYYGYEDRGGFCIIPSHDNAVIVCASSAEDNIYATAGAWQNSANTLFNSATSLNTTDIVLAKFSITGERIWATYFGDFGNEQATIKLWNDQLIMVGTSNSTATFSQHAPFATADAFQSEVIGTINSFFARFDNLLGIEENNNQITGLSIYPNPTTDIVTIQIGKSSEQVLTVYDLSGRIITTKKLNGVNSIVLNTKEWASGAYIINLQNKFGVEKQTVIKE